MFLFPAPAGSNTAHAAQRGWSSICCEERLQLTGTKSSRCAHSETTFPPCSLSIENIKLKRSSLTQKLNYFCCPYTRANSLNKDSELWPKAGAGGSANPADLLWPVRLTNLAWTQTGWARLILPKKIPEEQQQIAEFYVGVFLKGPGGMRLNKNESFHLSKFLASMAVEKSSPELWTPRFSMSPSYQ